jgi:hypothetical protein
MLNSSVMHMLNSLVTDNHHRTSTLPWMTA